MAVFVQGVQKQEEVKITKSITVQQANCLLSSEGRKE